MSVLHLAFQSSAVPTELFQCLMKEKHTTTSGCHNATFTHKYYLLLLWPLLCVEGHSLLMVWQSMVPILHRSTSAEWMAKYEKLTDMVVPRSSRWVHAVLCMSTCCLTHEYMLSHAWVHVCCLAHEYMLSYAWVHAVLHMSTCCLTLLQKENNGTDAWPG